MTRLVTKRPITLYDKKADIALCTAIIKTCYYSVFFFDDAWMQLTEPFYGPNMMCEI